MKKQHHFVIASLLLGCGAPSDANPDTGVSSIASISLTSAGTGSNATGGSEGTGNDPTVGSTDPTADGTMGSDGIKYDVGIEGYCQIHGEGIHCDGDTSIVCGPGGASLGGEDCAPDICLAGTGCVECLAGQYTCMADKVMMCNAAAMPAAWQLVEVCDPAAGEGCDLQLGACTVLQPEGGTMPTGEYYQFADFMQGQGFLGGYDVDSYGDRIYVLGFSNAIDVYEVELLDSDADGQLEPNQHPNNPDATGPIEGRTLTWIESIPSFGTPSLSTSEIYAASDRIYIAGSQITEYVFAGGATQVISSPPGWAQRFSHLGYDDVRGVWYAANENARRVFQHDPDTGAWGIAFLYPELAGDHMDGIEVVTDPETNIPYVYVSDMTSDFIGQYRLDPMLGWTQVNLFSYAGTAGAPLEGMGWGALYHFWATSGSSLYEIGGGDLAEFVEPPG